MRRPTVVVGVLVLLVLAPMWFVAIQGEAPAEEVEIDGSVSEIRPLAGFVDAPTKLSPSQVGVVIWVALFGLYATLVGAHRFMNAAVRPPDEEAGVAPDGGERTAPAAEPDGGVARGTSWLRSDDRWVVEYHAADESTEGIVVMGALTVLAIVFATLFTGEYLTLARTQYFGVYAAGMFLSLAALTVAYYAWFMPHVKVAERRGH